MYIIINNRQSDWYIIVISTHFGLLAVTSSSINVESFVYLVSRMSPHEGEENQPLSYHVLEVPLEAVAVGKDVDNKYIEEE